MSVWVYDWNICLYVSMNEVYFLSLCFCVFYEWTLFPVCMYVCVCLCLKYFSVYVNEWSLFPVCMYVCVCLSLKYLSVYVYEWSLFPVCMSLWMKFLSVYVSECSIFSVCMSLWMRCLSVCVYECSVWLTKCSLNWIWLLKWIFIKGPINLIKQRLPNF